MVFIAFMVLVAIVVLGLGIAAITSHRDRRIKSLEYEYERANRLAIERARDLNKAHKTLRTIANGAGNPVLEAQIALDTYESKELDA